MGPARALSFPFLEGNGLGVGWTGRVQRVGAGAKGRAGTGADTRCDRSRIDA